MVKRRRSDAELEASSAPVRQHSWEHRTVTRHSWDGSSTDRTQANAGAELLQHLLKLYARAELSAKDFCQICFWADAAGARGDFQKHGLGPGQSDGNYQKLLDRVLPKGKPEEQMTVEIPVYSKEHGRHRRPILVSPPHECFEAEDKPSGEMDSALEWASAYEKHPAVIAARGEMPKREVVPVALYLDGVRFTRPVSPGKVDSFLGFFRTI